MRHVLAPMMGEPEGREGEGGWIMAPAEAVTNPDSFEQFNQILEKRLTKWYSGEGAGIIVGQDRAILGIQNPIKFYVRVAEKRLLPRFPHLRIKNCCVWSASPKQGYPRRKDE